MCKFFSLVSDGNGNIFYFDYAIRKQIIEGTLKHKNNFIKSTDSHTSICAIYGLDEDKTNKWEYNVFDKVLSKDQINTSNDYEQVYQKVTSLDFKNIVPELIIKPIINPFRDIAKVETVTQEQIQLLNNWAAVWAAVSASVWDTVRDTVGDFMGESVWDSVRACVWDTMRDSTAVDVWYSVSDSVRPSVWNSMRDSVWASVSAYFSSFFKLKEWKYTNNEPFINPFQSGIELWEMGLVPSFDGKIWRLHSGKNADIVYEMKN